MIILASGCSHKEDQGPKPEMVCFDNLRHIDAGEQSWALANHKTMDDAPTWSDLQNYVTSNYLTCPGGGTYRLSGLGVGPTCSIPAHAALYAKTRTKPWLPSQ